MTPQELVAYYTALLILQYILQPKASATISALVAALIDNNIIFQVDAAFDINTAVGVQLDTLGEYQGAPRSIYGLDISKKYTQLPDYGISNPDLFYGFNDYDQPPVNWFFLTYQDDNAVTYNLNDSEYRQWILFLADVHKLAEGLGEVDALLEKWFGVYATVYDNEDMSILYVDLNTDPNQILFIFASHYDALPRPAGVLSTAIIAPNLSGFFAFNDYDETTDPDILGFADYDTSALGGSLLEYEYTMTG
jgi:hypothetical protein